MTHTPLGVTFIEQGRALARECRQTDASKGQSGCFAGTARHAITIHSIGLFGVLGSMFLGDVTVAIQRSARLARGTLDLT